MIRITSLFLFSILLFSCNKNSKKNTLNTIETTSKRSKKTSINPLEKAIQKSYNYTNTLNLDFESIAKKGEGDKKHFAELLGVYWKLYKDKNAFISSKEIKTAVAPYYAQTLNKSYHNMNEVDDKLFKKNSMSYLRVIWLLDALDFNTKYYKKQIDKMKNRMDIQMSIRGAWQKEVFSFYYEYLKLEKPLTLKGSSYTSGEVAQMSPINHYENLNKTYNLTHFVFAAFDYGAKSEQNRFSKKDLNYLKSILPKLTYKYREESYNIDILSELVTCMVFLGYTDTKEFDLSLDTILRNQNQNGSWGDYEKHRSTLGKDIEYRAYLHTTLVALEAISEYQERLNSVK